MSDERRSRARCITWFKPERVRKLADDLRSRMRLTQRLNRDASMPLGQALTILAYHQRHVRVAQGRMTQRPRDGDLSWRREQQIIATHDMRDAHRQIIDHDGELIRKDTIRALDNEVAHALPFGYGSVHAIDKTICSIESKTKRGSALWMRRAMSACAGIDHAILTVRRTRNRCDLLARTGTRIAVSSLAQRANCLLVHGQSRTLHIGAKPSTDVRSFIPIKAQPAQIGEHLLHRTRLHARCIEVFYAQHKRSLALTRMEPSNERSPRGAEMNRAGRRRSKATACWLHEARVL